jgi:hypothetical protein
MGGDWEAWAKLPTAEGWDALDWSRALTEFDEVRSASDGSPTGWMSPDRVLRVLWFRPSRPEELEEFDLAGAVDALLELTDGFAAVTGYWDGEDRGRVDVLVGDTVESAAAGAQSLGPTWPRDDSVQAIQAAAADIQAAGVGRAVRTSPARPARPRNVRRAGAAGKARTRKSRGR